jgi:hypothetical protein
MPRELRSVGGGPDSVVELNADCTLSVGAEPAATKGPSQGALPRQRWQEMQVLAALQELGYDPKRLPVPSPGIGGVKARCRDRLFNGREGSLWTLAVFDKAWARLRAERAIQDAP